MIMGKIHMLESAIKNFINFFQRYQLPSLPHPAYSFEQASEINFPAAIF
jgi:hypothetical protein